VTTNHGWFFIYWRKGLPGRGVLSIAKNLFCSVLKYLVSCCDNQEIKEDLMNTQDINQSHVEGSKSVLKPYRVTLRADLIVEIDVYAENVTQARGKAFYWNAEGKRGFSDVGSYYWTDENDQEQYDHDDSELYWEIIDEGDLHRIVDAVELEDGENDESEECVDEATGNLDDLA
jgi:hypothetical protein